MNNSIAPPYKFLRACFSSVINSLISMTILAALAYFLFSAARWLIIDASWTGTSASDCREGGACWVYIRMRMDQILYGNYPVSQHWRVNLTAAIGIVLFPALFIMRPRFTRTMVTCIAYGIFSAVMLCGGILGLPAVPSSAWGGLTLTVVLAAWTIFTAIPAGLLLALGRRSKLPAVAFLCGWFIDIVRSLPLLGLLFLVIVMFPLFMPSGLDIDRLLRAMIAFSIFNAANLAEVFRGGLQSVPDGQQEAASALGLKGWHATWLVIVPQAMSISVPAMINVCIAIIKETTIIQIVSLYDFLGVLNAGLSDPAWLSATETRSTVYAFAAMVFFIACFLLSLGSRKFERSY